MAISFSLDPSATAAADDAFYAKYPNMVDANGQRLPLDPDNPDHDAMCADWCDMYETEFNSPDAPPEENDEDAGEDGGDDAGDDAGDDEGDGDGDGDDDDVPGGDEDTENPCQTCDDDAEEEVPEEPSVTLRISVFFDGTGNNRANVGTEFSGAGESNVSKMERCCRSSHPDFDHYEPIYVEGIGTADGESDHMWDSATGLGDTGVVAKVDRGIELLLQAVDSFGVAEPVTKFCIDASGFSRGAAAARNFVWRMMNEPGLTLAERVGGSIDLQCEIEVTFLGLFDTVSSFGRNHENDVRELNLDGIYMTDTIVQLAAAEEHRSNFQLTTIRSGTQIYLPGVHSDVGGGYADGEMETDHQLVDVDVTWLGDDEKAMFVRERGWFEERGWFDDGEIQDVDFWNQLKGTRGPLTNFYSRIPLHLMVERASPAGIPFLGTIHDGDCTIATVADAGQKLVLTRADAEIRAAIGTTKCTSPSGWMNSTDEWHRQLRHEHLHLSARYGDSGGAHQPNWSTGEPVRGARVRGTNIG